MTPYRATIYAPSKHDPVHQFSGMRVIAYGTRVYPVEGPVESMEIPKKFISRGWRTNESKLLVHK